MDILNAMQKVKTALLEVMDDVYHYEAPKNLDRYIVWGEDGEADSLSGDNSKEAMALAGTIDLYTKTDEDEAINDVCASLVRNEIAWRLNSVQYEDETQYIHYEWVWEVGA